MIADIEITQAKQNIVLRKSNMNVLVTGISGYIGGQTALLLQDQGHFVVGVDKNLLPTHLQTSCNEFYCQDIDHIVNVDLVGKYKIDAIIHCAGSSLVSPSLENPEWYYRNNFVKTKRILDYLIDSTSHRVRFIFSSSAAVYGEPVMVPCSESDPPMPISPYGESKLMTEMMLSAYHRAYGLEYVAFRYFNACGADLQGRHGQAPGATHIIARLLESARDGTEFVLNGTSFPTEDGTCVRDYVHVEDIAHAHVLAIASVHSGVYNLGTSTGYSNKQIIDAANAIVNRPINISTGPARPGDPAILTASADRWQSVSGWQPTYDLNDMISSAWAWYNR